MKKLYTILICLLLAPSISLADRLIYTGETTAAERGLPLYLVNATDNETAETGITLAAGECRICKNGASCADCAGTWTEAEFGLYDYRASTGEINTLGYITVMLKDTAANVFVGTANVVAVDFTSSEGFIPARGTAQSATGTTLRLAAVEAFADDELNNNTAIHIVSASTGGGQTRCVTDYASATDTATVDTWTTTPTGTITYSLIPSANCNPVSQLLATTIAELSALPSASAPTVSNILRWLYQYGVGLYKKSCTSSTCTLFKDDGSTSLGTCGTTDSAGTYTRAECS